MDPIAFWGIRWYSILLVLAFIIGYIIIRRLAKQKGIDKNAIDALFVWLIISAIVGARLFEVFFYNPTYYFAYPLKILYVWEGGLASHGAIVGMAIATWVFSQKRKIKFYKLADIIVIAATFGAVLVRIGNYINQELVGKLTNQNWGVQFDTAKGLRHPVQLYQAATNFIVFFLSSLLIKLKDGTTFWGFLGIYSIGRFITEFWKDESMNMVWGILGGGINTSQWLSLIIIVFSIIALIWIYKDEIQASKQIQRFRKRKTRTPKKK